MKKIIGWIFIVCSIFSFVQLALTESGAGLFGVLIGCLIFFGIGYYLIRDRKTEK